MPPLSRSAYSFKGNKSSLVDVMCHGPFSSLPFKKTSLLGYSFSTTSRDVAENALKKDISGEFPTAYVPNEVESHWYNWWERHGFFTASPCLNKAKLFTMILPPPNVTGTLHLGHALTAAVQDAIARWHHMHGEKVLWIPGTDHAGIATQVVVEKQLWAKHRLTRHELGRDQFLEEVWKWQVAKGSTIQEQLRRMGTMLDWSQEYFTLDESRTSAVTEAFIKLFDDGLIYRNDFPVNWSCWLRSTISDVEVESHQIDGPTFIHVPGYEKATEFGKMFEIAYKLCDQEGEIVVSTTRPETILGDVAVAVHPDDPRYTCYIGSQLWHPYRSEKIPVISDKFVDPKTGTGAVKVTPAHNKTDFEVSMRHNLKVLPVIEEDGSICGHFEIFGGMKRFIAREHLVNDLASRGLLRNVTSHTMVLPICSRSGDVIELIPKAQWFLSVKELKENARLAVLDGKLKLLPERMNKIWNQWFNEMHDWCVSRQLWWGHRVPAYKCYLSSNPSKILWIAARSEAEARLKASITLSIENCDSKLKVEQDEDVLDTWFSSSLLPFSAFGWPENANYKNFYPLSLMETGNDILFFWVARMVMMGQYLTNQLPFNHVLLHGVVCDSLGRKMSKSVGNVVSPEEIRNGKSLEEMMIQVEESHKNGTISTNEVQIAKDGLRSLFPNGIPACGTDALRFTLCASEIQSQFINFDIKECFSNRLFCNKIWQSCRFVNGAIMCNSTASLKLKDAQNFNIMDRWILSRLWSLLKNVEQGFMSGNLHLCTNAIKSFTYDNFCDVYVESTKAVLKGNDLKAAQATVCVLVTCVRTVLLTLSPFMPFLSEELFQRMGFLTEGCDSIMQVPHPKAAEFLEWHDETLEKDLSIVLQAASAVRKLKLSNGFKNKDAVSVEIETRSSDEIDVYHNYSKDLESLGKCKVINISKLSNRSIVPLKDERATAYSLVKIVLLDDEQRNLSKKAKEALVLVAVRKRPKLVAEIADIHKYLQSLHFRTKSNQEHQKKTLIKLQNVEDELAKIEALLSQEPELRDKFQLLVQAEKQKKMQQRQENLDKRKSKNKNV